MKSFTQFIPAVFLFLLVVSCTKENKNPAPNPGVPAVETHDVAYGTETEQKMDIYLPSGRTSDTTKFMVLIHGGAWGSGDKADFNGYISELKKQRPGYAIFNINYRLASFLGNTFPAQENDVKSALEFILNKRLEYKISDQIVLLGASAGAHLAILQAYKYVAEVKAKAVIDFFGPTDITKLYDEAASKEVQVLLSTVTGTTPTDHPEVYTNSSPINFVNAQSPPTLILQGGMDPLVPPYQSELLRDKLTSFSVPNQYVFYPNESHGWEGDALVDSFKKIDQFLKLYAD